jgi:hypothetical protein
MAQQSACPVLMTGVPSCCGRPKAALHMGVPHRQDTITCTQQQPLTSSLPRSLCQRQLPLHPGWWLLPLSPDQWPYPRPMHRPQAVAVSTPALPPPTSAFVVAAEPATTKVESDLFFGDLEGLEVSSIFTELCKQAHSIGFIGITVVLESAGAWNVAHTCPASSALADTSATRFRR